MRFLALLIVSILAFTCPSDAATAVQKLSSASLVSASAPASATTFHTLAEDLSPPKLNMLCSNKNVPTGTQYITIVNDPNEKVQEQKGREGKIMVIAVSHEITSPRDSASGLATGRRQHRPMTITMSVDSSTPKLYRAFTTGATLPSITLEEYAPATPKDAIQGQQTLTSTTKLSQAQIASIQRNGNELTIQLTYQKITWTWIDGGIASEDTWGDRQ